MLTRLIYASTSTGPVDVAFIESILTSARSFNITHSITGMLCEGAGKFMQYIEGERDDIDELYSRILSDDRHKDVVLLDYKSIDSREYADWSMGFASTRDDKVQRLVVQATQPANFEPADLTAEQALKLIKALKAELQTQLPLQRDKTSSHGG